MPCAGPGAEAVWDFRAELANALPALKRHALKLTLDEDRADDLVHDCVERALRYETRFEPGTDLRAWLNVILRNLHANVRRRSSRTPFDPVPDIETIADPLHGAQAWIPGYADIKRFLDMLPHHHREILLMIAVGGLLYDDAARILDVPTGTVRSRLARARASFILCVETDRS